MKNVINSINSKYVTISNRVTRAYEKVLSFPCDIYLPIFKKYSKEVKEILDKDWRENLWMTIFPLEGEYYIARTYWGSQRSPQAICTYGGNTNSIGIESCVDMGSDLMHTWHITAQLVANLLVKYKNSIFRKKIYA